MCDAFLLFLIRAYFPLGPRQRSRGVLVPESSGYRIT
jgi:hypothetical protein